MLAPRPKQKAAAKAAAVRALGQLATGEAFDVLKQYTTDEPTEPVLEELKRAWGRFDRRDYASAMFLLKDGHLDLGIVHDIEGIDAVPEMTSLRIVVDDKKDDQTDLSPLAQCAGLRALQVQFNGPGMPSDIEWLRPLTGLRALDLGVVLRNVDLSPLVKTSIERLCIWMDGQSGSILLDMPKLTHLKVIAAASTHSEATPTTAHPDLADGVLTLAGRGVPVTVHHFDRPWAADVVVKAEPAGLQITAGHGQSTIHRADATGPIGTQMPDRYFV